MSISLVQTSACLLTHFIVCMSKISFDDRMVFFALSAEKKGRIFFNVAQLSTLSVHFFETYYHVM